MPYLMMSDEWQERGRKVLAAAIVVICYLVVFFGILHSFSRV